MTIKLYYNNPYITEFTSEIIDSKKHQNKYHIVLKETAFYPEGGGQPCDLGEINGSKVEYVYEENNTIYHVLDENVDRTIVSCKVNFQRRFDHMQQHSGEHLLSAAFFKLYGGKNIGFHLGQDYVTIDISLPSITKEMIKEVENFCSEVILKDIPVKCSVVNKEELNLIPIRKETTVTEDIRIVEIESTDYSACCGTHVNTTSEIGMLKIIKVEKYKGNSRIYFKCGSRALNDYAKKHEIISELVKLLSSDEDNIISQVDSMIKTIKEKSRTISDLKSKFCELHVKDILLNFSGNIYTKVYEVKSFEEVSEIGKLLGENNVDALIATTVDNNILLLANHDNSIDCGKVFKEHIKTFNGKGGGSKSRAQGSFSNSGDLLSFYNFISKEINNI